MERLHLIVIIVIGGILVFVIALLLIFYGFVFHQICCPTKRKSDRLQFPRESIPLTTITHFSSQPTELKIDMLT